MVLYLCYSGCGIITLGPYGPMLRQGVSEQIHNHMRDCAPVAKSPIAGSVGDGQCGGNGCEYGLVL